MMETAKFFLGFSLFVVLVVPSCGYPTKGSKSTDQSSGDQQAATSFASHRGAQMSRSAPVHYRSHSSGSVSQPVPVFVQNVPQVYPMVPSGSSLSSAVAGYPVAVQPGSAVPVLSSVPAAGVSEAVQVPVQGPGFSQFVQTGPAMVGSAPPVLVLHEGAGSTQPGPAQAGLPETKWVVAPPSFSEQAAADSQAVGSSDFLPPVPLPPPGPVLQSGETSNIVKEAELGNYQQQTEEFGYPAEAVQPGSAFTSVLVPGQGLGGFWGSPYPGFDYRLLYGLYPPGTYTTFSQNHEKGKDYYQSIHYLKEHVSEDQGPQQQQLQQKIFHGQQQRS
ncbi:uncharacterized protein LOC112161772 [Oryzias melastigma]|uniref:uncharacterized protein LOC112161772 n=1 Tax=Oryzias melastigma TaxID=30732 RepID=UPI000CF7CC4F|nr:uncharacterized protein LOC112161772 [Oryzias melastigma]